MGDAQAIPADLYTYSDQATGLAQDVATWVATVFAPALALYQGTAIDFGAHIAYITASQDGYLDALVRGALAGTQSTDRRVRTVGEAFEAAASSGLSGTTYTEPSWIERFAEPVDDPLQYATVTSTDGDVEDEETDALSAQDGAALAAKMNKDLADPLPPAGVIQADLQQLKANKNDGSFAGAFLAGLDLRSMISLLSDEPDTMVDLFTAALDAGTLTPATAAQLVDLMSSGQSQQFNEEFLASLKADPDAARAFFDGLDEQSLNKLLSADFSYPGSSAPGRQTVLFSVLLSTAQGISDPDDLQNFFEHIGAAMQGVTTDQSTDLARDTVVDFVSYCMQNTVVAPAAGEDLSAWFLNEGQNAGTEIEPWVTWLDASDNGANANDAFGESVISDIVEGAITSLVPGGLLIGIGENLATTVLSNWLVMWGNQQGSIPDYFPSPLKDASSFARLEFGLVSYRAVLQLLHTGQIVDRSDHPVPGKNIQDVFDRPGDYYVITPDPVTGKPSHVSVEVELSSMAGQYDQYSTDGAEQGGS